MEAEIWWMVSVAGCLGQIRRVRVTKVTDATVWIERAGGFVHKAKRTGKEHSYHKTIEQAVEALQSRIKSNEKGK